MAGRIRDEDIALVRERSPIAEVISEYVTLRPGGGGNLKGLCPFHDERTPSFNVSPGRGLFHCFGCGVGGDVIRFVMDVEHLAFAEAVERLAGRAGVQLRYEQAGPAPVRQTGLRARLVAAHAEAAAFYADQLGTAREAGPARDFLDGRGFDRAAMQAHGCGFAPVAWDLLTKHLLARGFSHDELVTAGLSRQARSGSLIDRFRRRLLWPIADITGDVVGFGARRIFDDDDGPKYLNTPETPIYKKSHVLYGLDKAKRDIARRRQAVIVEGYTDVMACHLAGVPTAVATCGTAFGSDHIAALRRLLLDSAELRGEVVFTFDSDEAGLRAAERAFEGDQEFTAQTFVAVAPDGMDPCELRQTRGDAAVRDMVARREPLFAFAIRTKLSRLDLDTPEGRVQGFTATAPLVARIREVALRDEYARQLSGWLGMPTVGPVLARVRELRGEAARRQTSQVAEQRPRAEDPRFVVERESLKLGLQQPALAGPVFDAIEEAAYTHPAYAAVRRAVAAAGGASAGLAGLDWVEKVAASCTDDVARAMVAELAVEPLRATGEAAERYAAAVLARLQELVVARQIAQLKSKLQRVNPVEEPDRHVKLFGELVALEQFRRGLAEQATGGL